MRFGVTEYQSVDVSEHRREKDAHEGVILRYSVTPLLRYSVTPFPRFPASHFDPKHTDQRANVYLKGSTVQPIRTLNGSPGFSRIIQLQRQTVPWYTRSNPSSDIDTVSSG
jgi:hypothetical protein